MLGPLQFCIYIRDVPAQFRHSNSQIYADDIAFYNNSTNIVHLCADLTEDLNLLDKYLTTTGSDQLPAAILKSCALVLAPSLTIIVNASLTSGIVPSALKQADIRPLFKAGDREAPKNYRPVSLLPVVS